LTKTSQPNEFRDPKTAGIKRILPAEEWTKKRRGKREEGKSRIFLERFERCSIYKGERKKELWSRPEAEWV